MFITGGDDGRHALSKRPLRIVVEMRVACGRRGVAMPQQRADQRQRRTTGNRDRRESMAQVVQPDTSEAAQPAELRPLALYLGDMALTVGARKQILPTGAPGFLDEPAEQLDGGRRQMALVRLALLGR